MFSAHFCCRGKTTRRLQNAHAYAKRHGRRGAHTPSNDYPDTLPTTLVIFATRPLPDSYLFHESLAGSDFIDESDLSQWDNPPPYHSPPPQDTPDEVRFTQNLLDVVHGCRLRLERESYARRAAIYKAGGIAQAQKAVQEARKGVIQVCHWDELHTAYVSNLQPCMRHKVMAECYLQWQARTLLNYLCEEHVLTAGKNPYA